MKRQLPQTVSSALAEGTRIRSVLRSTIPCCPSHQPSHQAQKCAQPLPTVPFWLLLTYPKADQHEEPEPQPQRQRWWGGRQALHLPVAPGLGGERNMIRGTKPSESQHPLQCPSPSCLLPPQKPREEAQPAPLPSPGTCCVPGRAAARPALGQGGGRGLSARPWVPGCCHRLLRHSLTECKGKSWCWQSAQPPKSPLTAHGFLAGRVSGCSACHPHQHPRDTSTAFIPWGCSACPSSQEGVRMEDPAYECKCQAVPGALEVKMQLSETLMLLWE